MGDSDSNLTPKKKIAVIGAGPAGLAAAYKLAQAGCEVDLYEAAPDVGGLSRSFKLWGYTVDLGPHRFFSPSEEVNQFWFQIVGRRFSWLKRKTRIFYGGSYFDYPLRPWNTFINLGPVESFRSLLSYCLQKIKWGKSDDTFEKWVKNRFGRRLFEIFFKTYSEKLWGIPCAEIDPEFAYRKIRRLSFFEILKKFVSPRKTYLDYFAYPDSGTGSVYKTLADRFVKLGGRLHLNSPVRNISIGPQSVIVTTGEKAGVFDNVISTMPLTTLVRLLGGPPAVMRATAQLKYRNTILVYLLVEGSRHFDDQWIYVHSPDVEFGRVTNFRNWSPMLYGDGPDSVLCLEYWCGDGDDIWKSSEDHLIAKATDELERSGLVKEGRVLEGSVIRVPKSYPVFKLGYLKNLDTVKRHLSQFESICSIGRYGAFKYNNQDHSLLMGMKAAENLVAGFNGDLSAINGGEVYEEDFKIIQPSPREFDEI